MASPLGPARKQPEIPQPVFPPSPQPSLQAVPPTGWPPVPDRPPTWDPAYGTPPAKTPSIALVLLITLFFGVFGAIPAAIHYQQARAQGASGKKYWITFAVVMAAWIAVAGVLIAAVAFTASTVTTKVMTPSQLDSQLVESSDWTNGLGDSVTATDAQCEESTVQQDGSGTYACIVSFSGGTRQTFNVTVGSDGTWVTGQ